MSNVPFDRAIDDVARRLTAEEPPADLRARVMSRIHDRAQPRVMWRFAPIAAGAAALAVVAATWTMTRSARDDRRPITITQSSPAGPAAASIEPSPASVASPDVTIASAPPRRSTSAATRAAEPSEAELAWRARALPALPQPSALSVEAIQPEALTIPQIDMKPLVTEPLMSSPPDGGGVKR